MVRFWSSIFLKLSPLLLFVSCTTAVPDVSSLGESLLLSVKSPSPWHQENGGNYVHFSGSCTVLTAQFQFKLDNYSNWSNVPQFVPAASTGEYSPVPNIYDVHCSDGFFDFYIYHSQIMQNITVDNGAVVLGGYEPHRIDIRTLDSSGNVVPGSITYERPQPSSFRLYSREISNWWMGLIEVNQPIVFEVVLVDANGIETSAPEIGLSFNLLASKISGPGTGVGSFYESNCLVPVTPVVTFAGGEKRRSFCYIPDTMAEANEIKIEVSGLGLIAQNHVITVKPSYSSFNQLYASSSYEQNVPPILVKNAIYKFKNKLDPFNVSGSYDRNVQSFSGDHLITVDSSDAILSGGGCTPSPGLLSCSVASSPHADFFLNVPNSSSISNLKLSLRSIPIPACASCKIYDSPLGSLFPISSYSENSFEFQVVSGSTSYSQPLVEIKDRHLEQSQCSRVEISMANNDKVTIPSPSATALSWFLSSNDVSNINYFANYGDCSNGYPLLSSVTFNQYDLIKVIYIKANAPSLGHKTLSVLDHDGTSFTFPIEVRSP